MKKVQLILATTVVTLFSTSAFAAGGLAAGTAATTDFKNWIYAILAIVAIIILLWQVMLAYGKKITWIDFLGVMGWTAVGGGVPALVTYLWGVWA